MTKPELPDQGRSQGSPWRSLATPAIAALSFLLGYITGNNYSLVDFSAAGVRLSAKPVGSVEATLQQFTKDKESREVLDSFILNRIRQSRYNEPFGGDIVHLARDAANPFSWGFTHDIQLIYSDKVPPSYFEVCKDSPLNKKEIVVAIFDQNGASTDYADRGSAASMFLSRESCSPKIVYTRNRVLVEQSQKQGFKARARELITLPIGSS
jgi:hypothetical protein